MQGNVRRLDMKCAGWRQEAQQQQQHRRQQQQQQQEQHVAHGRSAVLRRALLSAAAIAALPAAQAWHVPRASAAAAALPPLQPVAATLAGGPRSSLLLAEPQLVPFQPGPIAFPRRQLALNFAVLLARSGYEAVDDLDCVPMVGAGPRAALSGATRVGGTSMRWAGGQGVRGQQSVLARHPAASPAPLVAPLKHSKSGGPPCLPPSPQKGKSILLKKQPFFYLCVFTINQLSLPRRMSTRSGSGSCARRSGSRTCCCTRRCAYHRHARHPVSSR